MSAELTANWCQPSAQTTERPSECGISFAERHLFSHALGGSLTMLHKPLPARLIKASQLNRGREEGDSWLPGPRGREVVLFWTFPWTQNRPRLDNCSLTDTVKLHKRVYRGTKDMCVWFCACEKDCVLVWMWRILFVASFHTAGMSCPKKSGVTRPLFSRPHPSSLNFLPIQPPESGFYKQDSSSTGWEETQLAL